MYYRKRKKKIKLVVTVEYLSNRFYNTNALNIDKPKILNVNCDVWFKYRSYITHWHLRLDI
jgi:hypothetical protein